MGSMLGDATRALRNFYPTSAIYTDVLEKLEIYETACAVGLLSAYQFISQPVLASLSLLPASPVVGLFRDLMVGRSLFLKGFYGLGDTTRYFCILRQLFYNLR